VCDVAGAARLPTVLHLQAPVTVGGHLATKARKICPSGAATQVNQKHDQGVS
jgi:hypothetical protein